MAQSSQRPGTALEHHPGHPWGPQHLEHHRSHVGVSEQSRKPAIRLTECCDGPGSLPNHPRCAVLLHGYYDKSPGMGEVLPARVPKVHTDDEGEGEE